MDWIILAAAEPVSTTVISVGVASLIALFTTISGFVLKASSDTKKNMEASMDSLASSYIGVLEQKERQIESLIESRKDDLASQRKHFEDALETQNRLILDPIEKRVQNTEENLVYYREKVIKLRQELDDSRKHIHSLEEFKKKYETAVEYIDALIDYAAGHTEVPPSLSLLISEDINKRL